MLDDVTVVDAGNDVDVDPLVSSLSPGKDMTGSLESTMPTIATAAVVVDGTDDDVGGTVMFGSLEWTISTMSGYGVDTDSDEGRGVTLMTGSLRFTMFAILGYVCDGPADGVMDWTIFTGLG